ncbi:MAG: YceI family protein [Chthonomonadaceae bacterium]|nr:YceI family protein [Chthonomonadaceae bacterium]
MSLIVLLGLSVLSSAQSKKFVIGSGSPAQQLAQFESRTELETFTGRTEKVSGWINFDPAKKTGSGKIIVDVASISTGISLRDDHLRSPGWLDSAKFPTLVFQSTSTKSMGSGKYKVTGQITIKGVTKTVSANATLRHLVAGEKTKAAGFEGDVLQVRATFPIKLSDFGIKISGPATGKVSNTVDVTVTVYGQTGK